MLNLDWYGLASMQFRGTSESRWQSTDTRDYKVIDMSDLYQAHLSPHLTLK